MCIGNDHSPSPVKVFYWHQGKQPSEQKQPAGEYSPFYYSIPDESFFYLRYKQVFQKSLKFKNQAKTI